MKRFEFSLERLRSYKEVCLEKEKGILAKLNGNLARLDARIEKVHSNIAQQSALLNAKIQKGATIPEIKSYRYQLSNLANLLTELNREQRRMQDEVEVQMQAVMRANGELKGFEKLKEKKQAEYSEYVRKADEAVIAEFVSTQITNAPNEDGFN
ncbi:MAG: flagellar FliJ family protein [Oscillospiraceae bacterium]